MLLINFNLNRLKLGCVQKSSNSVEESLLLLMCLAGQLHNVYFSRMYDGRAKFHWNERAPSS